MARHFMAYWHIDQESFHKPGAVLNHAAGAQYRRVAVGDTVWIVTLIHGRLHLAGKIPVKHRVDTDTAIDLLGDDDIWDAEWHVISDPRKGPPVRQIPIHDWAQEIQFQTSKGPTGGILIIGGVIKGTALQTLRELTPDSVTLFEEALKSAERVGKKR